MDDALRHFDPLIADWFRARFDGATEPQAQGWPHVSAGRDVLISAPTGSGKTLAAFLICIDALVHQARRGMLADATQVVYVSPLKALSNDVGRNLEQPLAEIYELAASRGIELMPIRTAVRTGDTAVWERQRMLREPPHILVTTPESLFILLTAEKSRQILSAAQTVIVDEIHAMADDKRGTHLSLSLARLDALVASRQAEHGGKSRPQRIGLSATVKPIEEVAAFLVGSGISEPAGPGPAPQRTRLGRARGEHPVIVNVGHRREMDLGVEVPRDEIGAVATNEQWEEIYDRLAELTKENRTTLVFVNTRRVAERVAHHLAARLGEQAVLPHHGSLSRRLRLTAEERLKRGELRAVVATASLELGIDIGTVDLVCQVGSPRSIAVALQRIGRSGHWVVARPRGRLFATTRDELVECAALVRAIRAGNLDRLEIPEAPLDVLAQQIVAECAAQDWREDDLFALFRSAYPYRNLARDAFDEVVQVLSEGISTRRGRGLAYLHRDRVNGRIRGRRGARLAAITSGGTIPESGAYQVVADPDNTVVGTVDEDFAVESNRGDIFLLGTTSWKIRRIEPGRVRVENAHGAPPTVPFWRGEAPARTAELSAEVAALREEVAAAARRSPPDTVAFLERECALDRRGAEQAADYVRAGEAALGVVPSAQCVVAERFFDEGGGMQLVLHAPFGARINRAWGLALRKRFCRTFNFELQAAATDDGLIISLSDQHSFPLDLVFRFLRADTVEEVLTQAMFAAPFFAARWRWNAARALAILRFSGGRRVPAPLQRMRSDDLLAAVFPDQVACAENLAGDIRIPDHPLVNETIANCLNEAMDLEGLKRLLAGIEAGTIRTVAIETAEPSPFSHEILNANPYAYLDDAPLEERRARLVQVRRTLSPDATGEPGVLDRAAIEEVAAQSWPAARDADELHDALLTLVVLPAGPAAGHPYSPAPLTLANGLNPTAPPEWHPWFGELAAAGRASRMQAGGRVFWVPAEHRELAERLYPSATFEPASARLAAASPLPGDVESCGAMLLRGWMDSAGPVTARELTVVLALESDVVEAALARLESEGQVLRGSFLARGEPRPVEWCNRRLLARIHRLTLGRLRREIEPVPPAAFMRFLMEWQHASPGKRLHGARGVYEVLRQLQGYEIPASAWESTVLPARISKYAPELLDELCLSGEVMWGRLSPHPAFETVEEAAENGSARSRRVRPTRAAPLAIFLREDAHWLAPAVPATPATPAAPATPATHDGQRDRFSRQGQAETRAPQTRAPQQTHLSHAARDVLTQLERRGALFFNEIARAAGRLPSEVEDALWELVAAGLVTADGFENLRSLLDPKRRRGEGRGRTSRPRHAAGRWALLASGVHAGDDIELAPEDREAQRAFRFARQLLSRWGVIFRDLLARESLAPAWRDLLVALRRLEARGEIRGGRFVDGFMGEQFALPEAVEVLRAVRRSEAAGSRVDISPADPLNLVGVIVPGGRIPAGTAARIRLIDGVPATPPPPALQFVAK